MTTPFSGGVLPWSARYKVALPIALGLVCLTLVVVGLASPNLRTDAGFRPVLRGLLAGAAAFTILWIVMVASLRRRVTVDDRGVHLGGRPPIELGVPRSLRHGRAEREITYGRGVVRRRNTMHVWLAVEGADGRVVVFVRPRGLFTRLPDWPAGHPPTVPDLFDCVAVDIDALRSAIGGVITPSSAP